MANQDINKIADAIVERMYDPYNVKVADADAINMNEMIKRRKIWLNSDVDENIICAYRQIMMWNILDKDIPIEEREPIYIYIMNWGGILEYGWTMVDVILTSETPVYTVNMGIAASAASYIFIAGHKRFMMPRSKVIIHEGSAEITGDAQKIRDANEDYKKVIDMAYKYMMERTNLTKSQLMKKKNNDWYLNAEECLKYGICTDIINTIGDVL